MTDYILCCERYNQKHSVLAPSLVGRSAATPPDVRKRFCLSESTSLILIGLCPELGRSSGFMSDKLFSLSPSFDELKLVEHQTASPPTPLACSLGSRLEACGPDQAGLPSGAGASRPSGSLTGAGCRRRRRRWPLLSLTRWPNVAMAARIRNNKAFEVVCKVKSKAL